MIDHRGFRNGDWATWDPRSDVLILDEKRINDAASRLYIPTFDHLVRDHEFSHRFFYKNDAIRQILLFNEYLRIQFTTRKWLKQWRQNSNLRSMLKNYFDYFADVGMVLDVAHVFFLFGRHKQGKDPTSYEDLKKYSRIILGEKSKRTLEDFEWYRDNVAGWAGIINLLINFALIVKFCEGKPTSVNGISGVKFIINTHFFPSDLLFKLIDVLSALQETNPSKASVFFKLISSFKKGENPTYSSLKSLIFDLANYDPNLVGFIHHMNEDKYSPFTKCKIYKLQGKKFLKMDNYELFDQGPSVWWTKKEKHLIGTPTRVGRKRLPLFMHNFALTHLQECVHEGAELECILCQLGYCKTEEKKEPWITKLHNQIDIANRILYN